MAAEEFKRRLTAILSADVEGYSRLMREDEEATVRTITTYRTAMTHLIQQYRGRVVDSPGDNVLAEFTSVVDAVNCGVEMQRELAERNAELLENSRMRFRIGINLGDILEEGKRIYGDGVNIAARMESLAEAGEICISGTVYDAIENKIGLEYEYLGEHEVKNIDKPIRAYRVLSFPGAAAHRVVKAKRAIGKTWRNTIITIAAVLVVAAGAWAIWNFYFRPPSIEPASVEKMAYPLPDKPSIAVLPFVNMSDDPDQEYFSDGLTEEIITGLSQFPSLFVIARNSSFIYKGKPVKIQQVSEELGVRYVLEGSVRKEGNRVRITAQLIDAISGHHIWSERYDRELKDIFELQDDIMRNLIIEMRVQLTEGVQARIAQRVLDKKKINIKAYYKSVQSGWHFKRFNPDGFAMSKQLAQEAIEIDPNYYMPYVLLAFLNQRNLPVAEKYAQKALQLNDSAPFSHIAMGLIYRMKGQWEKAIAEGEKALDLEPNGAEMHWHLAAFLLQGGRSEEAIPHFEKALRLNPFPKSFYYDGLGKAYFNVGRYDEAIEVCKKGLKRNPRDLFARAFLAAAYIEQGREKEAQAQTKEILKLYPKFSIRKSKLVRPERDKLVQNKFIEALRKAGLPEHPPLPLPDKPSIAVLPFVNMSDDPKQEYFSDGITEEIITALSKTPKLFVIARTSSFKYKGKEIDVRTVGRELGVRYVLEGSVRKAEDRVRITAQLIDSQSGNHLWAERYDRELKDIFATQDEITMKILTSLQVSLTDGEMTRMYAKGTNNLDAYLLFLQGWKEARSMNKDGNFLGRQLAEKAIALDPKFAMAYNLLATTYMNEVVLGLSDDPRLSLKRAMELTQKAIALDNSLSWPHALLGWIYTLMRQHDKGIAECEQAVSLGPNSAISYFYLSLALKYAGRPREAIAMAKEAMRLNPIPPGFYYQNLTHLYCLTGQYEEAIKAGKEATRVAPNNFTVRAFLTVAYSLYNRQEEARIEAAEVLRINPKFLVDSWTKTMPFKNKAELDLTIGALRKAGLK